MGNIRALPCMASIAGNHLYYLGAATFQIFLSGIAGLALATGIDLIEGRAPNSLTTSERKSERFFNKNHEVLGITALCVGVSLELSRLFKSKSTYPITQIEKVLGGFVLSALVMNAGISVDVVGRINSLISRVFPSMQTQTPTSEDKTQTPTSEDKTEKYIAVHFTALHESCTTALGMLVLGALTQAIAFVTLKK